MARDKLAAALIEPQQEDELEMKNMETDNLVAEHERIVAVVEEEWRERESEFKDLWLNISELEANTDDSYSKFEAALAHLEETKCFPKKVNGLYGKKTIVKVKTENKMAL
ncbi:hypothetical protein B0H11DRAFT_2211938 [Mycena galericulata]|nr:hypothetical protein B0H11DRAFT_2211938 [Mycena galericulata]